MNEAQKKKLDKLELPEEGWYEVQNGCYVYIESTILWLLDPDGYLHKIELTHLGCV